MLMLLDQEYVRLLCSPGLPWLAPGLLLACSWLAPGQLKQRLMQRQACLGSWRSCIALERVNFFSLETVAYFQRAIKTKGPSPLLPREDAFPPENKGFCLSLPRGEVGHPV